MIELSDLGSSCVTTGDPAIVATGDPVISPYRGML